MAESRKVPNGPGWSETDLAKIAKSLCCIAALFAKATGGPAHSDSARHVRLKAKCPPSRGWPAATAPSWALSTPLERAHLPHTHGAAITIVIIKVCPLPL